MPQDREITADRMNRELFDFMENKHSVHEDIDEWEMKRLQYDSSWDHLMPIVESIEATHDEFHGHFGVHISSNSCCIQGTKLRTDPSNEHYAYFNEVVHETKIKATHLAVYQFFKWRKNQSIGINKTS
jgi:hypothetical protein